MLSRTARPFQERVNMNTVITTNLEIKHFFRTKSTKPQVITVMEVNIGFKLIFRVAKMAQHKGIRKGNVSVLSFHSE